MIEKLFKLTTEGLSVMHVKLSEERLKYYKTRFNQVYTVSKNYNYAVDHQTLGVLRI